MPIYEYICGACSEQFERLRPMSAAGQPLACPKCGGEARTAVSRLANVTGRGEGQEGAAEASPSPAMSPSFGHDHHGHSHGPGGHGHPH